MTDIDRDAARVSVAIQTVELFGPPLRSADVPQYVAALDRLVTAARAKEAAEARVEALKGALTDCVAVADKWLKGWDVSKWPEDSGAKTYDLLPELRRRVDAALAEKATEGGR